MTAISTITSSGSNETLSKTLESNIGKLSKDILEKIEVIEGCLKHLEENEKQGKFCTGPAFSEKSIENAKTFFKDLLIKLKHGEDAPLPSYFYNTMSRTALVALEKGEIRNFENPQREYHAWSLYMRQDQDEVYFALDGSIGYPNQFGSRILRSSEKISGKIAFIIIHPKISEKLVKHPFCKLMDLKEATSTDLYKQSEKDKIKVFDPTTAHLINSIVHYVQSKGNVGGCLLDGKH